MQRGGERACLRARRAGLGLGWACPELYSSERTARLSSESLGRVPRGGGHTHAPSGRGGGYRRLRGVARGRGHIATVWACHRGALGGRISGPRWCEREVRDRRGVSPRLG